jgi:hypothetical protein
VEGGADLGGVDGDGQAEGEGEGVVEAEIEVAVLDGGVATELEVAALAVGVDGVLGALDGVEAGEEAGVEDDGGDEAGGAADDGGELAVDDGGGFAVALRTGRRAGKRQSDQTSPGPTTVPSRAVASRRALVRLASAAASWPG